MSEIPKKMRDKQEKSESDFFLKIKKIRGRKNTFWLCSLFSWEWEWNICVKWAFLLDEKFNKITVLCILMNNFDFISWDASTWNAIMIKLIWSMQCFGGCCSDFCQLICLAFEVKGPCFERFLRLRNKVKNSEEVGSNLGEPDANQKENFLFPSVVLRRVFF